MANPPTKRPPTAGVAINGVRSAKPETLAHKTAEALDALDKNIIGIHGDLASLSTTTTVVTTGPANTPLTMVTIGTCAATYSEPDAQGDRTLTLTLTYGVPLGWSGIGVHAYVEDPDQSSAASFKLDGTVLLNGTATLGGTWSPLDKGLFPFVAGNPVVIKGIPAATSPNTPIRVYLNTYSTDSENQLVQANKPGATPSIVVTVNPPPSGPGGVDYAQNVLNFTVTTQQQDDGGGKLTVFFTVNRADPPSDVNYAGYDLVLYGPDPGSGAVVVLHRWSGSPLSASWPAPATINQQWVLYADSYNKNGLRNTIEFGVTPSVTVTVGTASGTLNLGKTQLASVSAAMAVVNGVLGVAAGGITTSLLGTFAVATANLQDAAVATGKLADGSVTGVKIANATIGTANIQNAAITSALIQNAAITTALISNAAITNALIANAAISDAKISDLSANKINVGTLTGIVVQLASNNTTTTLGNLSATFGSTVAGLVVVDNNIGSHARTIECTPIGFRLSSNTGDFLQLGGNSSVSGLGEIDGWLNASDAWGTYELRTTGSLKFQGHQVVGNRITGWGSPSGGARGALAGGATLTQVINAVNQLIADLQTHGLFGT